MHPRKTNDDLGSMLIVDHDRHVNVVGDPAREHRVPQVNLLGVVGSKQSSEVLAFTKDDGLCGFPDREIVLFCRSVGLPLRG